MGICLSTYLVMLTDSLSKTGLMLEKICWTWNYSVLRVKGCCPTRTGQMPINSLRGRWKIIELQSAELQSQWWKVNTKQHSTTQPHYWKIIDFLKIFFRWDLFCIHQVCQNREFEWVKYDSRFCSRVWCSFKWRQSAGGE